MEELVKRRSTLKGQLTRFDTFLSETQNHGKTQEIKARLAKAETLLGNYETIQFDIDLLEDSEIQLTERETFEDNYYRIISKAKSLIDLSTEPNNINKSDQKNLEPISNNGKTNSATQAKLPKIVLPIFSGNFKDWPTFHDLFRQLIHDNTSLSNIEKFMYLISSCKDEALRLAKNLPITEANYEITWNSFVSRYQNKRKLATCYLDEIQKIPLVNCKSANDLRQFIDMISENVSALKTLGLPVEQWDFMLLHNLLVKIDHSLRNSFELKYSNVEFPTLNQLLSFLDEQCKALELTIPLSNVDHVAKLSLHKPNSNLIKPAFKNTQQRQSFMNTQGTYECLYCNGDHTIYKCKDFIKMNPSERKMWTKSQHACFNCLRKSHMLSDCTSRSNCLTCGERHNTLLHINSKNGRSHVSHVAGESKPHNNISTETAQKSDHIYSYTSSIEKPTVVLLGTTMIDLQDSTGNYQRARALIDCGSQTSFISNQCCKRLCLSRKQQTTPLFGVSETLITATRGTVDCIMKPVFSSEPCFQTSAIVLSHITPQLPSSPLPSDIKSYFQDLQLADPYFDTPGEIDFLIGADLFSEVMNGGRIPTSQGLPTPHKSIFGWILMGPTKTEEPSTNKVLTNFVSHENSLSLEKQLKRFWELEEVPNGSKVNPEDELCEEHFLKTHFRTPEGRYVVQLPFKNQPQLGDSFNYASACFKHLERRLSHHDQLKQDYSNFIHEYEELQHMEEINPDKIPKYFIPHHAIVKESSSTTKLRVVFNASAKTSNGHSLNDLLLVGPKLQKSIVEIMINFRLHTVVFTTDICKMYRQILIDSEHQLYQTILWRYTPDSPLKHYMLKTVTYGISSAPFLALRVLQQLASDEGHKYPNAANILMKDIYVDDIVTGASCLDSAQELKTELIALLKCGGFELRKWASNDARLLEDLPSDHKETPLQFDNDTKETIKVLGVQWQASFDAFTFHVNLNSFPVSKSFTKRDVLSCLSRIFDPVGYVCPVVFWAKHLMQKLWTLGVTWNEPLPDHVQNLWKDFLSQIPDLKDISVPRQLFWNIASKTCELHGFCDASESGFCAAVYFRSAIDGKTFVSRLILAKSKVAPVKTISIPKLELCGAHLLSKLVVFLQRILSPRFETIKVFAWSDSTIALSWIKMSPHLLKTFVANRVTEVQQNVDPSFWHYVPSNDNPADCGSRGVFPKEILNHNLWWHGPLWLSKVEDEWPKQPSLCNNTNDLPEVKPTNVFVTTVEKPSLEFIERFSSFTRLQRVGAWCKRFIDNCRLPINDRRKGTLTLTELNNSLTQFVKLTQEHYLLDDIKLLKSEKTCSIKTRKLDPFLDNNGLLRVGGRIRNSPLNFDRKHPILLPKSSHLTSLLIDHYHKAHLHAGPQTTQFAIQRKFWILSARNIIRQRIHKCLKCFKFRKSLHQPFMADLPAVRLQQTRAFLHCAVDFTGPFTTKSDKLRKPQLLKSYMCLFICLTTKAVHLEVVSGLGTEQFLAAFNRFISRRGICKEVYSDRGTNFIGANNQLQEYQRYLASEPNSSKLIDNLATKGITWKFNPPASPHFGGIWESNIKSAKLLLKKVIGEQVLTFEELTTLFCQIEAVLNSRPLCLSSSDPNELTAFTPGHFLIGDAMTSIPEPDITANLNKLSRWKLVQHAFQHFWSRWYKEHIHNLQERQKWNQRGFNEVKVDDVVLLKEDNLPPLRWILGKIVSLHPGKDGVVRTVSVITKSGNVLVRPVVKICPLPN